MDDIEVDSAPILIRGLHQPYHHQEGMTKKLDSLSVDDQVDSGLGSIGYFSADLNSLDFEVQPEQKQTEGTTSLGSDLTSSLAKLKIENDNGASDPNRCDSGLVDDEHCVSTELDVVTENRNGDSIVQALSSKLIMEIFNGDEDGDNHLHLSIIHGLPEVTMHVINLAPDYDWLSQTNNLLQTPLHIAVITRQASVVRRLICAGASVDVRDQMGNTPLHNACRLGYSEIVRLLLQPVRYEETLQNRYEIPFQMIPQDMDMRNYEGLTCLHLAAIGGHINVMKQILSAGANVNAGEGKSGRTVLHMAADWGHIEMLNFLLSNRDLDIDAKTYAGLTPILLAFGRKHVDAMNVLYKRGASCETMSLSDESDMDNSDDEMMDEALYKANLNERSALGYLQTCR